MGAAPGDQFKNVFETATSATTSNEIIQANSDVNIETSESRRTSVVLTVNNELMNLNITSNKPVPSANSNSSAAAAAAAAVAAASTYKSHHLRNIPTSSAVATASGVAPCQKRFRSRSLPNIWMSNSTMTSKKRRLHRHQRRQHRHVGNTREEVDMQNAPSAATAANINNGDRHHPDLLLLPPVNLQSMQEIDLNEVLKNPQLRHDILFDPQIQFRPNLSGERGERKRKVNDNYWLMISNEIYSLINNNKKLVKSTSPLLIMFDTLKSILISLIPNDDKLKINLILDQNLIQQQLNNSSFNFNSFSNWICKIFKLHCAPMRDQWIDELDSTFQDSILPNGSINIPKLIMGLRSLFAILEAMKLDVANHQIRILRPLICSNAVEFEREYFKSVVKKNRINLTSSKIWFKKISNESLNPKDNLINGLVDTLSCSKMVHEFPNTFVFDHNRLISLRTDLRHVICVKICLILFKMMHQKQSPGKLINELEMIAFKNDIISIIVDPNGNSKWTKNLNNLSIQLNSKLPNGLNQENIDFCSNWLLKQTQPNSDIYKLLEMKLFKMIKSSISKKVNNLNDDILIDVEIKSILSRLQLIIDLNYNVFEEMYSSN